MKSPLAKPLSRRVGSTLRLLTVCFLALGVLSYWPAFARAQDQGDAQKEDAQKQDEQKSEDKQADEKKADEEKADAQDEETKQKQEEAKAEIRGALEKLGNIFQGVAEATVDADEPFVDEHFDGGITLEENRELKRKLDLAREQIAQGKVVDTVKFLGELLTDTDTKDFFLAPEARGRLRTSFRAAVQEMIAKLPAQGLESYELLFGSESRKMLERAVHERNWNLLNDVVRRYYHTEAGAQALYLLGTHYMDLDRPREALVCLERLKELQRAAAFEPRLSALVAAARYRAGDVQAAINDVEGMRDADSEALGLLAGETGSAAPAKEALATPADIQAWLAATLGSPSSSHGLLGTDWITARGAASRNATADARPPLLSSQSQHEIGTSYAIKSVEAYRRAMNAAKMAVVPVLHPVVVGDDVLISTDEGLQVRNLVTGVTWNYPTQKVAASLDDHFWCGSAFGSPSTNGQFAFVVEGQTDVVNVAANSQGMRQQVRFRRGMAAAIWTDDDTGSIGGHLTNALTAVDLASGGKRRWKVGGGSGGDEPLLAGVYFLGSPLAYGGRVYSIGEFQGSLRLLGLNAQTGKLEWNQELAIAEAAVSADTYRRMAGATPSIADGVIVCPTSCGGVVALDLTTQSLLWAYRYPRRQETIPNQGYYYGADTGMSLNQGNRWIDATAVIAAGCVLVTPLESDELHCLDLRTGELKWKKPRGNDQENLFIACVEDGKCVMVGRDRVIAWNLADGKPSWSAPIELPKQVYPAGQGVHAQGEYLLPLSNATVARIDLAAGTISDTQTTRRELPLGNLVYAQGQYLSLGPKFLETFPVREQLMDSAKAALAADPANAQALTQMGEILQADGVMVEAIEHFRKAYELEPTPRRKNLLTAALLTGVREGLPGAAEFEDLLNTLPPN